MITSHECLHARDSEPCGEYPVEGCRRAATLNMPQDGDTQLEVQVVLVLPKIREEFLRVVLGAFSDDDQRMFLSAFISSLQQRCDVGRRQLAFGNDDSFRTTCKSRNQSEISAVSTHRFDEQPAMMGRRRNA